MATYLCGVALGPGTFDQYPTSRGVTGLGDGAWAAALATGGL
jgi:hypothetical protein